MQAALSRVLERGSASPPPRESALSCAPPPPSRTKWTRRVPHPVLIGHAASLTQVGERPTRRLPRRGVERMPARERATVAEVCDGSRRARRRAA